MAISIGVTKNPSHPNGSSSSSNPSPATSNAKFSLALGAKKPSTSSTTSLKPASKRPHTLLEDDDHYAPSDLPQRSEAILTFGQGTPGATSAPAEAARVIQSLPNRDWREESKKKRQKSGLPGDARNGNGNPNIPTDADVARQASTPAFGLTVARPASPPSEATATTTITNLRDIPETLAPAPPPPLTADEEALHALTAGPAPTTTTIRPPSPPPTETSAFRASYTSAPRMASLDEYAATPVEGFGAAILRGYLAAGETLEARAERASVLKERVRRPGLLGIGAKETAAGLEGVELGAWGRGVKKGGKGKREEVAYMPLAMRNKATGEIVDEEEMKRRVEAGKMVRQEEGSRRSDGRGREGRKMVEDVDAVSRDQGRRERDVDGRRYREEKSTRKEADGSHRSRRDEDDAGRRRRTYDDDGEKHSSRDKERSSRRDCGDGGGRDDNRDRRRIADDDYDRRHRDRERDHHKDRDRRESDRQRR